MYMRIVPYATVYIRPPFGTLKKNHNRCFPTTPRWCQWQTIRIREGFHEALHLFLCSFPQQCFFSCGPVGDLAKPRRAMCTTPPFSSTHKPPKPPYNHTWITRPFSFSHRQHAGDEVLHLLLLACGSGRALLRSCRFHGLRPHDGPRLPLDLGRAFPRLGPRGGAVRGLDEHARLLLRVNNGGGWRVYSCKRMP